MGRAQTWWEKKKTRKYGIQYPDTFRVRLVAQSPPTRTKQRSSTKTRSESEPRSSTTTPRPTSSPTATMVPPQQGQQQRPLITIATHHRCCVAATHLNGAGPEDKFVTSKLDGVDESSGTTPRSTFRTTPRQLSGSASKTIGTNSLWPPTPIPVTPPAPPCAAVPSDSV